jgi:uncharacterized protein
MSATKVTAIDAEAILRDILGAGSRRLDIVRRHGELVARRALRLAARREHLAAEEDFIHTAAMLHDIGIVGTDTPQLDCRGAHPYICHGVLGRQLLEARGLPAHGLVCERHVGVGITAEEIRSRGLPLPVRDMRPVTVAEQLVAYADKFYSKTSGGTETAKSAAAVARHLRKYGRRQAETFIRWAARFENIIIDPDAI